VNYKTDTQDTWKSYPQRPTRPSIRTIWQNHGIRHLRLQNLNGGTHGHHPTHRHLLSNHRQLCPSRHRWPGTIYGNLDCANLIPCKEWRRRPIANRTWPQFKTFFANEYNDLKEQQKLNNNQHNFHGANNTIDLTTAIDSLGMAATSDRDVITQLTLTNKQLVQTNQQLTDEHTRALAELAQHKTPMPYKPTLTIKTPTPHNGTRPPFDHAAWLLSLDPQGYCWSHGYKVARGHNSKDCKGKIPGHQDGATRTNTMGGSEKGKPRHMGDATSSDYSKINKLSHHICYTPSIHQTPTTMAIADIGASGHYIRPHDPHQTDNTTQNTITVGLPNGDTLQSSTNNCTLNLPQLLHDARMPTSSLVSPTVP
jgi:hypothetical protein